MAKIKLVALKRLAKFKPGESFSETATIARALVLLKVARYVDVETPAAHAPKQKRAYKNRALTQYPTTSFDGSE